MKKKEMELIYIYCSQCENEWVEDKQTIFENGTECPFCHCLLKLRRKYGF